MGNGRGKRKLRKEKLEARPPIEEAEDQFGEMVPGAIGGGTGGAVGGWFLEMSGATIAGWIVLGALVVGVGWAYFHTTELEAATARAAMALQEAQTLQQTDAFGSFFTFESQQRYQDEINNLIRAMNRNQGLTARIDALNNATQTLEGATSKYRYSLESSTQPGEGRLSEPGKPWEEPPDVGLGVR